MSNRAPLDLSKVSKHEFPMIKDLSYEQENMVNKLYKTKRVLVDAIAGSGKTTVLTSAMNVLLGRDVIDRIYYVVFPVQEGSIGFLPGDIDNKIKQYAVPFRQALIKAGVNPHELDLDVICNEQLPGKYKAVPHTFLRGRTIFSAGIIVDEAQNGTLDELQKSFTRIEDCCYLAIAGHNGQIDIPKHLSGLSTYVHHFKRGKELNIYTDIEFASLTHNYRGAFSTFADQVGKYFEKDKDKKQA